MNTSRFDTDLKNALGDAAGVVYSSDQRTTAMYAAVREFSRYRPVKRQFGFGALYAAVTATATTITVIGGPFAVGDILTIDPFFSSETRTVTAVAVASDSADGIGTELTLTLTSALSNAHAIGALVTKSVSGLAIVGGTARYALPFDFVGWDGETFDIATGRRGAVQKVESFNDQVNKYSELIGGVGPGASQGFSGAFGGYPIPAVPGGPSSISPGGSLGIQTVFNVTAGSPPYLTISPVPNQSQVLDPIFYFGQHTPASVPDAELHALICYAAYSAIMGRVAAAGYIPGMGSFVGKVKDDEQEFDSSSGAKALSDAAGVWLQRWERAVASRPFAVSG